MPFTEVNGKRLFYVHSKPEASQDNTITVLLVHGLGSSHVFYSPVVTRILEAGYSCVAYDTYGSALSAYTGLSQDVKSMAADALGLIQSLQIAPERTVVVGHSMGGMVACQLGSMHRFAGIVLLGPVHPNPAASGFFVKRIETVAQNGMEAMADTIPKAAVGSKATPSHSAWIRSLIFSQKEEGYISLCKVISEAVAPEYSKVESPVLILAGADDKSAPLEGCKTILESIGTPQPSKTLEILDGVGHWHCVEAPEAVAQQTIDFLRKL